MLPRSSAAWRRDVALAGGWWIGPDCNIPGGESFARQVLYASATSIPLWAMARTGYVDSLGTTACSADPQKRFRISWFMRPMPHEMEPRASSGRRRRLPRAHLPAAHQYGTWSDKLGTTSGAAPGNPAPTGRAALFLRRGSAAARPSPT
jgi:hypothetical protein